MKTPGIAPVSLALRLTPNPSLLTNFSRGSICTRCSDT